jgi:alcohol dehydrogenase (cytochrome c)
MTVKTLRGRRTWASVASLLVAAGLALAGSAAPARAPSGDWLSFGRTADNSRHSPLTQITRANVDTLGRIYRLDFQKIDPDVRRGQQSYPLAIGGTLYVTTNDDNVFAVDGRTGKILWQYKPTNSAVFKNFGIVANRGLAYCDGLLFITQLDMKLVALRAKDGQVVKKVSINQAVPNASSNYGYSETSAPICANHTVLIGAAGSEYGIRGFVMAYHTDLTPAWPNPYWTVPPEQQGWRRYGRLVGGGAVWTPVTVDVATNTVYFGTGSATPLYFKSMRPGPNPRTDALIAVDLKTGKQRWWQELLADNQWAYDVSQPPLVYAGKVGGRTRRVVSVATMEGVWFAFDAATGRPFHERVKVIDRIEHPSLQPGQPVTVFPSSLGGLNYSPAAYDPTTNYVVNAAAETAVVMIQKKLTPTQKKRKRVAGDIFLGLENGNFGTELQNWHDHGSISAIDISSGRRVWKFNTPEPERGGVTTTATGVGFAGGGDGVLRAFDVKTGKVLWTFQTGQPIAAGPTVFLAGGKEYVAITVGGTPTSSGGGTASELHVFGLGGSQEQSPRPSLARVALRTPIALTTASTTEPARAIRRTKAVRGARIVPQRGLVVRTWTPSTNNERAVAGKLLLRGRPVAGATVVVDHYRLPDATDARGRFTYPADLTVAGRHIVRVAGARHARVNGRPLTAPERTAVLGANSGFNVGFKISELRAHAQESGNVVVTGRATYADGSRPPLVSLFTYRLSGTITDASGKPVEGATVVTRTLDRDFWTFSQPSNASGRYVSFFSASDEVGADPVPMNVQVAHGRVSYSSGTRNVMFERLRSGTLDLVLPASGAALPVGTSHSYAGAIYQGLLVGVSAGGGVIKPVAARWPDASGRFSLTLPASVRGKTLSIWESTFQAFSRFEARPGGPVDLESWPRALSPRVARGVAFLAVR